MWNALCYIYKGSKINTKKYINHRLELKHVLCVLVIITCSIIMGCGRIIGLVELPNQEVGGGTRAVPVVILTGSTGVEFSIERFLSGRFKTENPFSEISAEIDLAGNRYRLQKEAGKDDWFFISSEIFDIAGWGDIILSNTEGDVLRLEGVVRVIDKFRVTLTFDDGPAVDKKSDVGDISTSPTVVTLDGLDKFVHGANGSKTGIKAAFFVLTTEDEFFKIHYQKAETSQGKAVLREVASRGHVLCVHDGGDYKTQNNGHNIRATLPAYGVLDKSAEDFANALEADLYECVTTIENNTGQVPMFVRPPLWRYSDKRNSEIRKIVEKAYDRYGLKMILTDAKFPDGGYYIISIVAVQKYPAYRKNLERAFLSGEDNLVISMHDANKYTANIIGNLLNMIGEEFEKVEFAGSRGLAGNRLDFADTSSEVIENLMQKHRYTMFPAYRENVSE